MHPCQAPPAELALAAAGTLNQATIQTCQQHDCMRARKEASVHRRQSLGAEQ